MVSITQADSPGKQIVSLKPAWTIVSLSLWEWEGSLSNPKQVQGRTDILGAHLGLPSSATLGAGQERGG